MPIQERKISFGDPLAVLFIDTLVVPKLLCINDFSRVELLESGSKCVLYKDKIDGVWLQIGTAPSENESEIRGVVINYIRWELLDMYEEGLGMFDPEHYQFAIGPAIKMEDREPYLSKDEGSVGIWHKQVWRNVLEVRKFYFAKEKGLKE